MEKLNPRCILNLSSGSKKVRADISKSGGDAIVATVNIYLLPAFYQ